MTIKTVLLLFWSALALGQSPPIQEGREITKWHRVKSGVVTIDGRTDYMVVSIAEVKRSEETVRIWLQISMPNGSWFALPGTDYGEIRYRAKVICTEVGRARADAMIAYGRKGEFLYMRELDEASGPELKGSVGQAIYTYICERGGREDTGPPKLKPRIGK